MVGLGERPLLVGRPSRPIAAYVCSQLSQVSARLANQRENLPGAVPRG